MGSCVRGPCGLGVTTGFAGGYNTAMTRTIPAIYENGVFRPTQPVDGLPEHAPVQLTIEAPTPTPGQQRLLGLQRDQIIYVAPDFDAELGDEFWLGNKA